MRKRYLAAFVAIGLLAGCGSQSPKPTPSPSKSSAQLVPPSSCADTKILGAMKKIIPGATWINTSWMPAAGTDLEAIYKAGGIACSYGLASAEVGGTFSWARDTNGLFESRIAGWKSAGQQKVDIPGVSADSIYAITDSARSAMEIPSYSANVLVNGVWIQLGGAFIQGNTDAAPYIKAAIDSLKLSTPQITGCYIGKLSKDIYYLDIMSQKDNHISASVFYDTWEKDDSTGTLDASYTNGILNGLYTFDSEGSTSVRELFFKGDALGFVAGYGPPNPVNGEYFARPLHISWDKQFTFLPAKSCKTSSVATK